MRLSRCSTVAHRLVPSTSRRAQRCSLASSAARTSASVCACAASSACRAIDPVTAREQFILERGLLRALHAEAPARGVQRFQVIAEQRAQLRVFGLHAADGHGTFGIGDACALIELLDTAFRGGERLAQFFDERRRRRQDDGRVQRIATGDVGVALMILLGLASGGISCVPLRSVTPSGFGGTQRGNGRRIEFRHGSRQRRRGGCGPGVGIRRSDR